MPRIASRGVAGASRVNHNCSIAVVGLRHATKVACGAADLGCKPVFEPAWTRRKAPPGAGLPNATYFSQNSQYCINRGADPLVGVPWGPVPPDPLFACGISHLTVAT